MVERRQGEADTQLTMPIKRGLDYVATFEGMLKHLQEIVDIIKQSIEQALNETDETNETNETDETDLGKKLNNIKIQFSKQIIDALAAFFDEFATAEQKEVRKAVIELIGGAANTLGPIFGPAQLKEAIWIMLQKKVMQITTNNPNQFSISLEPARLAEFEKSIRQILDVSPRSVTARHLAEIIFAETIDRGISNKQAIEELEAGNTFGIICLRILSTVHDEESEQNYKLPELTTDAIQKFIKNYTNPSSPQQISAFFQKYKKPQSGLIKFIVDKNLFNDLTNALKGKVLHYLDELYKDTNTFKENIHTIIKKRITIAVGNLPTDVGEIQTHVGLHRYSESEQANNPIRILIDTIRELKNEFGGDNGKILKPYIHALIAHHISNKGGHSSEDGISYATPIMELINLILENSNGQTVTPLTPSQRVCENPLGPNKPAKSFIRELLKEPSSLHKFTLEFFNLPSGTSIEELNKILDKHYKNANQIISRTLKQFGELDQTALEAYNPQIVTETNDVEKLLKIFLNPGEHINQAFKFSPYHKRILRFAARRKLEIIAESFFSSGRYPRNEISKNCELLTNFITNQLGKPTTSSEDGLNTINFLVEGVTIKFYNPNNNKITENPDKWELINTKTDLSILLKQLLGEDVNDILRTTILAQDREDLDRILQFIKTKFCKHGDFIVKVKSGNEQSGDGFFSINFKIDSPIHEQKTLKFELQIKTKADQHRDNDTSSPTNHNGYKDNQFRDLAQAIFPPELYPSLYTPSDVDGAYKFVIKTPRPITPEA